MLKAKSLEEELEEARNNLNLSEEKREQILWQNKQLVGALPSWFAWYSTSHLAGTVVWPLRLLKIRSKTFSVPSVRVHELHQPQLSLIVCSLKQRDSTPQLWMCLWSVAF